jgi:putative SOS response-associated peptidase YedK
MCGRYARFTPQHLYSQLFRAADMGMLSPRYNVAPSQAVLVARNSEWGDNPPASYPLLGPRRPVGQGLEGGLQDD